MNVLDNKTHLAVYALASLICVLFAGTVDTGAAHAASLRDYNRRVREAAVALDALASSDAPTIRARFADTQRFVREKLPPSETVEWQGTVVRVNNSWLHDALTDYEGNSKLTAEDQAHALNSLTVRLLALNERLSEAEKQSAGANDKEEARRRLSAILRRPEYANEVQRESALQRLWQRFIEWLRDLFPNAKPLEPGTVASLSKAAQVFVIALALAVLAFAIWKLVPLIQGRRKRKSAGGTSVRVVLGEEIAPEKTPADLLAEAETLAREGNLRAAIRKAYIALLIELGDRRLLPLAQHKTNRDYLLAVRNKPSLHDALQPLVASFERHWYGFVPATETDWGEFRARCQQALKN
ncbi:MAG: DUF4129 domain-containing protein [Pyrinomonadaceae bacterium]|nr:DUF4129 domain-containing protein [Pyrinomonadaceae bacterium]